MTTAAWAQLEPAVSALFKRLATVPGVVPSVVGSVAPSVVQHAPKPGKLPAPGNPTTLLWTVIQLSPVGKDEVREEYFPGTYDAEEGDTPLELEGDTYQPDPTEDPEARLGGIIASVHGHRVWTIEVRVESKNQSKPAVELFRALVDRMRLPSANAELEAVGLAYTGWDEITDDEYDDEEGRATSVYLGRLYFNGSSYAEDAPITTIEDAEISATLKVD